MRLLTGNLLVSVFIEARTSPVLEGQDGLEISTRSSDKVPVAVVLPTVATPCRLDLFRSHRFSHCMLILKVSAFISVRAT